MITLRDLLETTWDVTLLDLDVRHADGKLIKHVVIGKDYVPSQFQLEDEAKGLFEYICSDINKYGRNKTQGNWISYFEIDFKQIPNNYLGMEVDTVRWLKGRYRFDGQELAVTVVPIQMEIGLNG